MKLLVVCLVVSLSSCRLSPSVEGKTGEVLSLLHSYDIQRLEIIYLPVEILTRSALTPEMLEKGWQYKIIISHFVGTPVEKTLGRAIEASTFDHADRKGDMRWGCIFYSSQDTRVLSIYFDGSGCVGVINGEAVLSNGKVVNVLRESCAGLWK